ncbi:hypothetical protein OPV22_034647 [Ensete ventricosum]|uniref:Uncharacterized protein n=1 Tax=Ensete ventricosum TaxID=4639 RepID=A0AAV8P4I4_ENSVE|nr:hypothetical protein OPV22_034647 [Ensete ventricosum]
MASPPLSSPSGDDGGSLVADPGSQAGSAAGSLQGGDGVLSAPPPPSAAAGPGAFPAASSGGGDDADYGFQRPGFRNGPLVGTVQPYDRHLFLCYKSPEVWPSHVEGSESDRLPRFLAGEIKNWASSIDKKTRLTICEGVDGTDFSNGDVLIFPDMIRYRRLTHFDVEHFVDEVLKKNSEWLPCTPEPLSGSYIFVCAHGSRDRRCGVCGPGLIKGFKEEITSRDLQGQVFVSPCSHIGGHKYAGNVIIFSPNASGQVTGHWYGYVTPDDVPILLEQHIGKGKIVDHLWRGQMGLSEDEQRAAQNLRLQLNGELDQNSYNDSTDTTTTGGCCQGSGEASCCQVMSSKKEKPESQCAQEQEQEEEEEEEEEEAQDIVQRRRRSSSSREDGNACSRKEASARKLCPMPTWFECWEREDTYAALAVVAAIASVAVAYSYYRQLR